MGAQIINPAYRLLDGLSYQINVSFGHIKIP